MLLNRQTILNKEKKSKKEKTGNKEGKKKEKEEKEEKEERTEKKKLSLKTKLLIAAGLVILLIAAGFVGLYMYSPIGKLTRPIFKNVPFPVAIIGNVNVIITSSELISNVEAVRKFYESQDYSKLGLRVDFSTDEGKKRLKIKEKDVFDKLIEDKIVEKLAKERGIVVTTADAQKSIEEKIAQSGDRRPLESDLDLLYGWSINEFRDKIVVYQMYIDKLFKWYAENTKQQKGYKKIVKANEELKEDGSNFVDIAREFSEGESAKNDGEIGWFPREQLVKEVADVAFEMRQNEISDIIISPLGFHIVQVQEIRDKEEQKENDPGEMKEVKLRQIFVKGTSFLEWIGEEKKKAQVLVLMKDYRWDSGEGRVRFVDKSMERIEKKLRIQAEGDPSL